MRNLIKYNPGAIVWSILILVLLLLPTKGIESPAYSSLDKLIHTVMFGMLCYLCITGRVKRFRFSRRKHVVARNCLIFTIIFGIFTEILQLAVGHRGFDVLDIAADIFGALVGYGYFQFWISKCLQPTYNFNT